MNCNPSVSETFAKQPWPAKYQRLESQWLVACDAASLGTKPQRCVVLGVPIVLYRTRGAPAALLDRCPHRGAPLSSGNVTGDCVRCPYHGWQFSASGTCVRQPGLPCDVDVDKAAANPATAVPAFPVCEANGWIWVSLKPPHQEPVCRRITGTALGRAIRWTDATQADWVDGIENVLDATHTPFVHAGLVRSEAAPQSFDATVRVRPAMVEVEYKNEGKQTGWISRLFERDRTVSYGRFIPPCVAQLEYQSRRGIEFLLNVYFTPTHLGAISLYSEVYTPQSRTPFWIRRRVLTPLLRRVYRQDFQILKIQQENLKMHRDRGFVYWEGDLMRGWIETWLQQGKLPEEAVHEVKLKV